jgi:hypothetical protein
MRNARLSPRVSMSRIFLPIALLTAFLFSGLIGCGDNSATRAKRDAPVAKRENPPESSPPLRSLKVPSESWDILLLQGKRLGYSVSTRREVQEDGQTLLRNENASHLAIQRGEQTANEDMVSVSVETPEGRLVRFECEMRMGDSPLRTIGNVRGDRLEIETFGPGAATAQKRSIAWSTDDGGPLAVESALLHHPMQPGQQRAIKAWMMGFERLVTIRLTAKQIEAIELPGGKKNLLRIETVTVLPGGQEMRQTVWADTSGEIQKSYMATAGGMESIRTSKAAALKESKTATLDLLPVMAVKIDRPLLHPHETKQVTYHIHLGDGDPAKVFVVGSTQAVKSLDAHTAEVTVFAVRPGAKDGNRAAPADPPTKEDLAPNGFIQSDDPLIVADAKKAAGAETDPWKVATALERFVYQDVNKKDFSQAFASASEVARTHEGDCTEHGVFLAALARARGIPARVAIGLVYLDAAQSFFYHLWTEVYIDGRWIPIDGTLARGGIGADHLEIAHTSLAGASAYSAFLPVAQVVGQMKIEIVEQR